MVPKPPIPPKSATPFEREFEKVFNPKFMTPLSVDDMNALKQDEVYAALPKKNKKAYLNLRQSQIEFLEKVKFLLSGPQQKLPVVEKAKILYATLELIYQNIRAENRAANLPTSELDNFVYNNMIALADTFKRNRYGLQDKTTADTIPYSLDDPSYVARQSRVNALQSCVTKNLPKQERIFFQNLVKVLPKEITIRNETGGGFIIPAQQIPECGAIERNYNGLTDAELRAKNIRLDTEQLYKDARREMVFYNENGTEFEFLDDSGQKVARSKMTEEQFVKGLCRYFNLGDDITQLLSDRLKAHALQQKVKPSSKSAFQVFESVLKERTAEIDPEVFIVLSEFHQGALFPGTVHVMNSILSETPQGREMVDLERSQSSRMDIHKTKEGYKFNIESAIVGVRTTAYQLPPVTEDNPNPIKTDVLTGGVVAKKDEQGKIRLEHVNKEEIEKAKLMDSTDKDMPKVFTVKNEISLVRRNGKMQYSYGGLELSGIVIDANHQLKYNAGFYSQTAREARALLVELMPRRNKQVTLKVASDTLGGERGVYQDLLSSLRGGVYHYDPPVYNIFRRLKEAIFPSNTNKLNQELNKLEVFLQSNSLDYEGIKTTLENITSLKRQLDQSLGIQPQAKVIPPVAGPKPAEPGIEPKPKKHLDLAQPQKQLEQIAQQNAKEVAPAKHSLPPNLKKVIPGLMDDKKQQEQAQYQKLIAELQKKQQPKTPPGPPQRPKS